MGQKPCLRKYLFCAHIALKTAINKRPVAANGIAVALEGLFRNTKKIESCYPRSMAYNVTLTARVVQGQYSQKRADQGMLGEYG